MFCQKSTFHRNFVLEKTVILTFFLTKLFFQILIKNFSDHLCTSFFLQKSSLTFQIVLRKNLVDTANQWKNIQEPPPRLGVGGGRHLKDELFFPDFGAIYVNRSTISISTSFKDFLLIFGANESWDSIFFKLKFFYPPH